MDELSPNGEFHHFQLVNQEGEVPLSISVLVHYNAKEATAGAINQESPISADEIIAFHEELQAFDGDFAKAFAAR